MNAGERELVLFHRIAEPESAAIRTYIVERGLKPRIDFQNVETDGAELFRRRGGRRTPALWDGRRLHEGADSIRVALGAIIGVQEQE